MARGEEATERKTGVAAWNETEGTGPRKSDAGKMSRQKKSEADKRRRVGILVVLCALCVACVVCVLPIKERITRGLWLKSGTAYVMKATSNDGEAPSQEDLSTTESTITKRLGMIEVSDAAAQRRGDDTILIEFPWFVEDAESLAQTVGGSGMLEFVRMDEIGDADALAKLNAGATGVELKSGTYTAFMDGSNVKSASVTEVSSDSNAITFIFDDEGAQKFADTTEELAEDGGSIAIVVGGRVLSAPYVSEKIEGGEVSISGDYTKSEANAIKAAVETDQLPLTLSMTGSEKVDALIGSTGKIMLPVAALAVFVVVFALAYRSFGKLSLLVAGTMAVYAITMLGLVAVSSMTNSYVLTIPGVIAGFAAAGFAVATVWAICADFRAKVSQGGSIKGASISSVREGLIKVRVPFACLFVISAVLVFVPVLMLRDFGVTFVLGAVCAVISVFWFAVTTLRVLASGAIQADPAAWGAVVTESAGADD